jgi:16S rRNA (cytidine1402-2'-O)-methyltransferase
MTLSHSFYYLRSTIALLMVMLGARALLVPNLGRRTIRAVTTQLRASNTESGHAYFIATPIGNLGDITLRAIEVLGSADIICAEDTRHTRKLLQHLNITPKRLISHHEHNAVNSAVGLISLLREGNSIALVSDAGTPGISDPGGELAAACAREGIPMHPIPGPSAVVSALSVCGFSSSVFTFVGFIPVKGRARRESLESIRSMEKQCVVLYEAPHRMLDTMTALQELNNERPVCVCRELTKVHEEIMHGTVGGILSELRRRVEESPEGRVRGEFCLVLGPVTKNEGESREESAKQAVISLEKLRMDGMSRSAAVKEVVEMCDLPKSSVYKMALGISGWSEGGKTRS